MSIYEWSDLLSRWQQGKLTAEQALGQVFLRLQNVEGATHGNRRDHDALKQQVSQLSKRLDALEQQSA